MTEWTRLNVLYKAESTRGEVRELRLTVVVGKPIADVSESHHPLGIFELPD